MSKVTMLVGSVLCACALTASAKTPSMPAKAATAKTMNTTKTAKPSTGFFGSLWGDVKSVPGDLKSLFVTDKDGKVHQVKVGPATKVKGANGKTVALASLKPGMHVHVTQKNGTAVIVQAGAAGHGSSRKHMGTAVKTH